MWFYKCIFEKTSHLKPLYSECWAPIIVDEFYNYIALLFYMSIVTAPNISAYWSQSSIYLWLIGQTFNVTKLI